MHAAVPLQGDAWDELPSYNCQHWDGNVCPFWCIVGAATMRFHALHLLHRWVALFLGFIVTPAILRCRTRWPYRVEFPMVWWQSVLYLIQGTKTQTLLRFDQGVDFLFYPVLFSNIRVIVIFEESWCCIFPAVFPVFPPVVANPSLITWFMAVL